MSSPRCRTSRKPACADRKFARPYRDAWSIARWTLARRSDGTIWRRSCSPVADLGRVWVELAVGPTDLPMVAEGQTVSIAAHGLSKRAVGRIVFISPILDKDTHSARVVAEIANPDGNWRPGSLVHAAVAIEERSATLAVPVSAIQTIGKMRVLFVRTTEGFEKRQVILGDGDDRLFEVLSGVREGETIAVSNTFALKAEFMKSLAE